MSLSGIGAVLQMELTPCEFKLMIYIAESASDGELHYPDWHRIQKQTGFSREQINRMLQGLWQDDLIGVVGALFLPVASDMNRRAGIRIGPREQARQVAPSPEPAKSSARGGYIYLIHGVGTTWYKIGHSIQPEVRTAQLGTQGPFKHDLLHCFEVDDVLAAEKLLHALFANVAAEGEWFCLTADDVYWFCELEECTTLALRELVEERYGR